MEDELPSEYDAIVLGTGLPESITAAALARVGFKVLHLDRDDHYSGQWTTFTFDSLLSWIKNNQAQPPDQADTQLGSVSPEAGEYLVPVPTHPEVIHNVVTGSYFRKESKEGSFKEPEGQNHTEESLSPVPCASAVENTAKPQDADNQQEKDKLSIEELRGEKFGDSGESHSLKTAVSCQAEGQVVEQKFELQKDEVEVSKELEGRSSNIHNIGENDAEENSNLDNCNDTTEPDVELSSLPSDVTQSQPDALKAEELPPDSSASSANENQADTAATDAEPPSNIFRPRARLTRPPISTSMTFDDLKPYFRRFNIDLAPKVLFSRGPLVEALISANISHYAEFKAVNRILTHLNGQAGEVPCSRSDVFSSRLISVIEKRMLMKFLTFCVEFELHPEEYKEFEDKTFLEFLQSRRLTPNLQHFALYAIAMATSTTPALDGLKATQNFLKSLGRYGNTPFIWPLYGAGEMPQAFCRMCAVFGGLYCLRRSASALTISKDTNQCTGVVSDGQRLQAKWIIMEYSYVPASHKMPSSKTASRAVFITNKSLKSGEDEYITLLTVPPQTENGPLVRVIELGSSTMACPQGLFVVHFIAEGQLSAQEDLESVAKQLFCFPVQPGDTTDVDEKPVVLWSLYFNQSAPEVSVCTTGLPDNIMVTSLPGTALGFGQAMEEAKEIFKKICPNEEFLPAVPNPEDILWDEMIPAGDANAAGFGAENPDEEPEASGASRGTAEEPEASGASRETVEEPEASGASRETTGGPGTSGVSLETAEESGSREELKHASEGPGAKEALEKAAEEPGMS